MANLIKNMADKYDSTQAYDADSIVVKESHMYYAKTDIAAGTEWSTDKWQEVYLADLLRGHLNSDLGGKAPVLLWTNSSPTSSFSAQTISLDLSGYEQVIVEFLRSNNDPYITSRVLAGKNEYELFGAGYVFNSGAYSLARNFYVSDTGIVFNNAYEKSTSNDGACIPYKIYGVNLNLAD